MRSTSRSSADERHPTPPGAGSPAGFARVAERSVVVIACLQALASAVAAGFGVVYALESASPDNGSDLAGLGVGIGIVVAVLGVGGAAVFAALAVGLRRRFRVRRHTFAAMQAVLAVLVLQAREAWTWPVVVYLVATVVLCYVGHAGRVRDVRRGGPGDVENATPAPSQGAGAATTGRDDDGGERA
ncbi:hypothetical protein [Intrasporangium flavum]|uniref:hypothetical protein n=1 Tax=Intrasporangium flavum TaxID=1428657 RepID=UPI001A958836|nr:hypothetical protein [Intrasporangium flavum]